MSSATGRSSGLQRRPTPAGRRHTVASLPAAAGPRPSAAGPMAAGPMAAGPMAEGPTAAGPMAAGPSAAGPRPTPAGPRHIVAPQPPVPRSSGLGSSIRSAVKYPQQDPPNTDSAEALMSRGTSSTNVRRCLIQSQHHKSRAVMLRNFHTIFEFVKISSFFQKISFTQTIHL